MGNKKNKEIPHIDLPDDLEDLPSDLQDIEPSRDWSEVNAAMEKYDPVPKIRRGMEILDTKTGAPVRAMVGHVMDTGGFYGAGSAGFEQFLNSRVLPSTPSGKDIAYRGMSKSIDPVFAEDASNIVGPFVEGGLDPLAIPFGPEKLATNAVVGIGKRIPRVVGAVTSVADKPGKFLAKGVLGAGHILTGKNVPVGQSLKAIDNTTAFEHLLPELFTGSSGRELGRIRIANKSDPKIIAGSGEEVGKIPGLMRQAEEEALNAPNIGKFRKKVENKIGGNLVVDEIGNLRPKDLTVSELDMLDRNVNSLAYTPFDNKRALEAQIKPYTGESKKILQSQIAKDPGGVALLKEKGRYEGLKTAEGGGSKLRNIITGATLVPSAGFSSLFNPRTYQAAVALGRMPKYGLNLPFRAIGGGAETIESIAKTNPRFVEYLMRSSILGQAHNAARDDGGIPGDLVDLPDDLEELE